MLDSLFKVDYFYTQSYTHFPQSIINITKILSKKEKQKIIKI